MWPTLLGLFCVVVPLTKAWLASPETLEETLSTCPKLPLGELSSFTRLFSTLCIVYL